VDGCENLGWDVMRDLEGAVGTIEGVIEELTTE
jgi:hypothetical protein